MNWITTKEDKYVSQWNQFILTDKNISFVQSIHRVRAYEKYGMDWELLLCIDEEDNVLLGSANVIIKMPLFKLYICSNGPTIAQGFEDKSEEFFEQFKNRAQRLGCLASQISVPNKFNPAQLQDAIVGSIFTNVASATKNSMISLKTEENQLLDKEALIATFSKKGRRDVRASYRKGLTSKLAKNEEDLKQAYACVENNARMKGYQVRAWDDMKDFILASVKSGNAYVITAWFDEEIQGAVLLERSSNYLSYSMGGVKRHTPDLLTGYFLQTEAMMLAISLELDYYDVSYEGPKEVQRFKKMFNPKFRDDNTIVHFKHSSFKYNLFKLLYGNLKKYAFKIIELKRKIAK